MWSAPTPWVQALKERRTMESQGPIRWAWVAFSAVAATLAGFGATAFRFYPLTYAEYMRSGSLFFPWLGSIGFISAAVAAFAGRTRVSRAGIWLLVLLPAVGSSVAVLGRIGLDVRLDATSHNLWPIEVALMFGAGLVAALLGGCLGLGLAMLRSVDSA